MTRSTHARTYIYSPHLAPKEEKDILPNTVRQVSHTNEAKAGDLS